MHDDIRAFSELSDFMPYTLPMAENRANKLIWHGTLCIINALLGGLLYLSSLALGSIIQTIGRPVVVVQTIGRPVVVSDSTFYGGFLLLISVGLYFSGITLIAIAIQQSRLWRRYKFNPETAIHNDKRKPIIYLRPFYSDVEDNYERWDKRSFEEFLAAVFADVGPMVAVGRPKETLPLLGATRLYFGDDEWKEKVTALLAISQLTIVHAGYSVGLEWELHTIKEYINPTKVIVSFVHWREKGQAEKQTEYEIFKLLFERVFNKSLPEKIGKSLFLTFDSHWESNMVGDINNEMIFYCLTTSIRIRKSLQPYFKEKDIQLMDWQSTIIVICFWVPIFISPFLCFLPLWFYLFTYLTWNRAKWFLTRF